VKISSLKELSEISWRVLRIFFKLDFLRSSLLGIVIFFRSFLPILSSGAFANLINKTTEAASGKEINQALIWAIGSLFAVYILEVILDSASSYTSKIARFSFEEKLDLLIARKNADIDIALREDPASNNLFQIVKENNWRFYNFGEGQFYVAQDLVRFLVASVALWFLSPTVLLVLFVGVLPELIVQVRYGREAWGIYAAKAETKRRLGSLYFHLESTKSLSEFKIFQITERILGWVRDLFLEFQNEQRIVERKKFKYYSASASLAVVFLMGGAAYFVSDVVSGGMEIGTLVFALSLLSQFRTSLSQFFSGLSANYENFLFMKDIFKFLDLKSIVRLPVPGLVLSEATPEITFEKVSFKYPGQTKLALKNITLQIKPGEKVALVGENGAGKTTFVKLLCRFYDAEKGRVLLDGTNIKEVNLDSWYDKFGVLFQEYTNYDLPVWEQISLGSNIEPDLEKIKLAARNSGAADFIERWEKGYDQMIGNQYTNGVEPSVGQRQKLALARVFYRDPQVWILDEPTASIDPEAEEKIFERLEQLPKDRTVFLISHRFSTVRHADRILVFKDGEIVEQGTHKELLKLKGLYEHLFSLQAKGYK
jgi:ATP-binding cassette subfamily B protein